MLRSKSFVFVPFCVLAQGVRAQGIVRKYPAVIKPVVQLLIEKNINIVQMRCPELEFDGFIRQPRGKGHYDNHQNRIVYRKCSFEIFKQVEDIINHGNFVKMILGIDFSPSCAVNYLSTRKSRQKTSGQGIFIEEIQGVFQKNLISIPFIGIQVYRINKTLEEISDILSR